LGAKKSMGKKLIVKIHELLKDRDISMRELSRRTDIRHAALSALGNQKRKRIQVEHIERIAEAQYSVVTPF
jgi:putative transcriptional regulator